MSSFKEKPDTATADQYVADGNYYWNSGTFLFKASTFLAELKAHRPDIYDARERALGNTASDLDFIRIGEEILGRALMILNAVVVPLDAG